MGNETVPGAEAVCAVLEQLSVEKVFGLPGTQTISLFEALRRSSLQTILTGSELAALFAAGGYYRACGKIAAVTTIPGPGFTLALTGLAEAFHDSAALLYLVVKSTAHESKKYRLQVIDQRRMAEPVVKRVFELNDVSHIGSVLTDAFTLALSGEPGPVMIEIDDTVLSARALVAETERPVITSDPEDGAVHKVVATLIDARRPIMFCGQGAAACAEKVRAVSDRFGIPVVTTGSGRGVLPENHAHGLRYDFSGGAVDQMNGLVAESDLVLAIGCKFSHNGSAGYRLKIPSEKLVHVDTSMDLTDSSYPASVQICCDAGSFLDKLCVADTGDGIDSSWKADTLKQWRGRLTSEMEAALPYVPKLSGGEGADISDLFHSIRSKLPDNTILVTDSGYHQALARTFWEVRAPRGLLTPTDFQSMGFGIPAAIGAALACSDRPVAVVVGDGGLIMSGMELLTAVREKVSLTIILVNDHSLGQIRMEQLREYGHEHATRLNTPDVGAWCHALRVNHFLVEDDFETTLDQALAASGVTVVEIITDDSPQLRRMRTRGLVRNKARRLLGPGIVARLKKLIGRT